MYFISCSAKLFRIKIQKKCQNKLFVSMFWDLVHDTQFHSSRLEDRFLYFNRGNGIGNECQKWDCIMCLCSSVNGLVKEFYQQKPRGFPSALFAWGAQTNPPERVHCSWRVPALYLLLLLSCIKQVPTWKEHPFPIALEIWELLEMPQSSENSLVTSLVSNSTETILWQLVCFFFHF